MTDLGSLDTTGVAPFSEANAISSAGVVVGVSGTSGGSSHAFRWSKSGGLRDLNDLIPARSDWVLDSAEAVNDMGQIVGNGLFKGNHHAFLLTPLPPPRLSSPTHQSNGQFRLTLVGETGRSYTIEASTNLANWIAVTNFVSATGTNEVTDPTAPNFSRRFYRAVTQ